MANAITFSRIVFGVALIFFPSFSVVFYVLYLLAGFSDMIDGTVARKTNTVSEFGSKLDTFADSVFVAVCLYKILPTLEINLWIWVLVGVIAAIKIFNFILCFTLKKQMLSEHSVLNKVTGLLLFLLPLSMPWVKTTYTAPLVCAFAFFAALQETYLIIKKKNRN